jgi:hypothetical protein
MGIPIDEYPKMVVVSKRKREGYPKAPIQYPIHAPPFTIH